MEKIPEIDGVAFALGKLTEALLEQIHRARDLEIVVGNLDARLRARTRELEEARGAPTGPRWVEALIEKWKKEDEE